MKIKKYIITFLCLLTSLCFAGCQAEIKTADTSNLSESIVTSSQNEESIDVPKMSYDQSKRFSNEYRSCKYYRQLMSALKKNKDSSFMQRVLDIALSQEGYLAYALEDMSVGQVREEGNLWTGATARNGSNMTGNTEYTRWFYEYIFDSYNPYIDCEWCSIFVSWCMYQAGYHSDEKSDPEFYYSYCADPRKEFPDSIIQSFNLDQNKVWYTPTANIKLDDFKDINIPVHTDISPYDIPYKKGGLVFFSWDGTGWSFEHIGIVTDYDKDEHILTYIGGNDYSSVMINSIDFDTDTFDVQPVVKNSERIMAYAEYDAEQPLKSWYIDEYDNSIKYFTDNDGNKHFYYNERYYNS